MTAQESPAQGGASETVSIAAEFVLPIVATTRRHFAATPPRLSESAVFWLREWADALADGTVSLAQLPPVVSELFLLGYGFGEHSRQPHIDRLTYERDMWHYCAVNRKKPGDYLRHQTSELWRLGSAA